MMDICLNHRRHQCENTFDEETCRYSLQEVGRKVVPSYPFSHGIDEVFGMIVDKYGLEQAADVISILQELLEDENNAGGSGDDGDIWRSWRHSWRYRNKDPFNPFVPRVGNIVLEPATSSHWRHIKAVNFLQQQYLHYLATRRCCETLFLSQDGDKTAVDTQPADRGSDIPLSLEQLAALQEDNQPDCDRKDCCGYSQHCQADLSHATSFDQPSNSPRLVNQALPHEIDCASHIDSDLLNLSPDTNISLAYNKKNGQDANGFLTEYDLPGVLSKGSTEAHEVRLSKCEVNTPNEVTQETNAYNKHNTPRQSAKTTDQRARLTDGTVFTTSFRQPRIQATTATELQHINRFTTSSIVQRSYKSAKKQLNIVYNRYLSRLLSQHKTPQVTFSEIPQMKYMRKSRRDFIDCMPDCARTGCRHPKIADKVNSLENQPAFGVDGASDDLMKTSKSSLNLNKPLPLSPTPYLHAPAQDVCNESQPLSQRSTHLPSTASSTLSQLSTRSSRSNFMNIARDILKLSPDTSHGLSSIEAIGSKNMDTESMGTSVPDSPIQRMALSITSSTLDGILPMSPAFPPLPLELKRLRDAPVENLGPKLPASKSLPTMVEGLETTTPVQITSSNHMSGTMNSRPRTAITADRDNEGVESQALHTHLVIGAQSASPGQNPPKRSRSPIKRLLHFGKYDSNISKKKHDDDQRFAPKTPTNNKRSIKKWSDKIRYGFLTPEAEQLHQEELTEHYMDGNTPPFYKSSFPVSLEPPTQAKLQSEIELYLTVTANRYLMKEAKAGRLSAESVARLKGRWANLGRPQVVEFHYDQLYQHDLVFANLATVKLYGDSAKDRTQVQSTLNGWRVMAREMSVRTFCSPDSVLRKHLHDAHRVLELLGAPLVTFLAYEDMQIKSLQLIAERQRERVERKHANGHARSFSDGSRLPSEYGSSSMPEYTAEAFQLDKVRLSPSSSPIPKYRGTQRKATGAEGAIMSLPSLPSRMRVRPSGQIEASHTTLPKSGRTNITVLEKPEDLLL